MRRATFARLGPIALVAALALTGCGGEDPAATEAPSSTEATGDGSGANAGTIEITFEGDSVEPSGERVEAEVGSELVLQITADQPGELHIHTNPEQEIAFGAGTTKAAVSITQPGVVEIESHDLDVVVLQIEAS